MLSAAEGFAYSYEYFLLPSQKVPEAPGFSDQIWDSPAVGPTIYLHAFTAWHIAEKCEAQELPSRHYSNN